jgi:hypothetical protein
MGPVLFLGALEYWKVYSIMPAGNRKITGRASDKNYTLSPRYKTV